MTFIETIINNSSLKEAKLYGPALKASERPETGITIQNPSAFHVIRDCARFTHQYLPHFVFGSYANPINALKGKFKRQDIEEFVTAAKSDIVLFQLLTLVLDRVKIGYTTKPGTTSVVIDHNSDDPYGEYENYTATPISTESQDPVTLLCQAFEA